jgi:hypothetical protein
MSPFSSPLNLFRPSTQLGYGGRPWLIYRNKPWSHTTTFEKPNWRQEGKGSQFGDTARGNEVMKAYD